MMSRRYTLLGLGAVGAALAGLRSLFFHGPAQAAPGRSYEVTHTEAEWKQLLTPAQFDVLRHAGTEPPFSSPLDREKRQGIFSCAGCSLPLFSSKTKFESGTGWPSFYQPLAKDAVDEHTDTTFGMQRTEVLCHRCGGHLGHVFSDGPKPTGLRYCMNGLALKFTPAQA
jgi:peptide-methionine (R)-S-oxide reductase